MTKKYSNYEETFHLIEAALQDDERNCHKRCRKPKKYSCSKSNCIKTSKPYPTCEQCPPKCNKYPTMPVTNNNDTLCISPTWVITPIIQTWLKANRGFVPIISTTAITPANTSFATIPTGISQPCAQDITFFTLKDNIDPNLAPPQIQPLLPGIQLKGNERRIAVTIPAYGTTALDMFKVAQFLQPFRGRTGPIRYDRILMAQMDLYFNSKENNARILTTQLLSAIQNMSPSIRIDVYAHSAGATVARYMMEILGVAALVDKYIPISGHNWCIPPDIQIGGVLAASFATPGCVFSDVGFSENGATCTQNNHNQPFPSTFYAQLNTPGSPWSNSIQYFAIAGTNPNDIRPPPENHDFIFGPLVDTQYKIMFGENTRSDGSITVENQLGIGITETKSAYTAANPGINVPGGSRRTTTHDHITNLGTAIDLTGGQGYHFLPELPLQVREAITDFLNI